MEYLPWLKIVLVVLVMALPSLVLAFIKWWGRASRAVDAQVAEALTPVDTQPVSPPSRRFDWEDDEWVIES